MTLMSRSWKQWIAMVALTAVVLVGVRMLAHFPSGSPPTQGMMRLAWRMAGEKVKLCRKYTQEELDKMLVHMRRPEFCREHLLSYRLRVALDGTDRVSGVFVPPGAKSDRPLFIQEEILLAPGRYQLMVEFLPQIEDVNWEEMFGGLSEDEKIKLQTSLDGVARIRYQGPVNIQAGRIVLVDLDERDRTIVVQGG